MPDILFSRSLAGPPKSGAKKKASPKRAGGTAKPSADKAAVRLNARPDRLDLRDRPYQPKLANLPEAFPPPATLTAWIKDYTKSKLVRNQGPDGACTGFGLAAVINHLIFRERKLNKRNFPYSTVSPVMGLDAALGKAGGNFWGLAAICLHSGMFSRLVTDKLYEVFATLLAVKPQDKIPRNDGMTEGPPSPEPTLTRLEPSTISIAKPVPVKITGTKFTAKCQLQVGDTTHQSIFTSPTELELPASSVPTRPGKFSVVVIDGGTNSGASATMELEVTA